MNPALNCIAYLSLKHCCTKIMIVVHKTAASMHKGHHCVHLCSGTFEVLSTHITAVAGSNIDLFLALRMQVQNVSASNKISMEYQTSPAVCCSINMQEPVLAHSHYRHTPMLAGTFDLACATSQPFSVYTPTHTTAHKHKTTHYGAHKYRKHYYGLDRGVMIHSYCPLSKPTVCVDQ